MIQTSLRDAVVLEDSHGPVRRIAGADVAFIGAGRTARAAIAVLSFPGLDLIEKAIAERPCDFPYVTGLLSFREVPVLLHVLERLSVWPDLVLCDGQGYAHPRRLGLACHLGLAADLPTIGVAKTRLIGRHGPVPAARGDWTALVDKEETIRCGAAHPRGGPAALCLGRPSRGSRECRAVRDGLHDPLSPAGDHQGRPPAGLRAVRRCHVVSLFG